MEKFTESLPQSLCAFALDSVGALSGGASPSSQFLSALPGHEVSGEWGKARTETIRISLKASEVLQGASKSPYVIGAIAGTMVSEGQRGASRGMKAGAAVGSLFSGIGTLPGTMWGGVFGALSGIGWGYASLQSPHLSPSYEYTFHITWNASDMVEAVALDSSCFDPILGCYRCAQTGQILRSPLIASNECVYELGALCALRQKDETEIQAFDPVFGKIRSFPCPQSSQGPIDFSLLKRCYLFEAVKMRRLETLLNQCEKATTSTLLQDRCTRAAIWCHAKFNEALEQSYKRDGMDGGPHYGTHIWEWRSRIRRWDGTGYAPRLSYGYKEMSHGVSLDFFQALAGDCVDDVYYTFNGIGKDSLGLKGPYELDIEERIAEEGDLVMKARGTQNPWK